MQTTFEDLIDEMGGFSRFQILITFCIVSCQLTVGWSMLQMSYAGMIPDFNCLVDSDNGTDIVNGSLNVCKINETICSGYKFDPTARTVMSEWSLVCDMSWVKATITSIQMFGVLVGALVAGQLSDVFGRRKALYAFVLEHIIFNFIAAFSTGWVMFAALRFFIGIGIGAIVVVVFPYPMEFLPVKWRPLLSIIPSWTLGVAVFAGAALILNNWSHLHLACAVFSLPSLLGCFVVPESIRWLAVHGRLKEAEEVFKKMARMNRKPLPINTSLVLQNIIVREKQSREEDKKYTYIDLFRSFHMTKISIVLWIFWFTLATVYYGISFGVASLSGNIYLNILLLGILELPIQTSTFYFNNKIGRRWSSLAFYGLTCLASVGCLVSQILVPDDVKGPWITGFSQTAKMMVGAAWSCTQTWGSELYPTVTRNLGYGFSNMGARVGGILAPFIVSLDDFATRSYSIMTGLLVACIALTLALPETRGTRLLDSIGQEQDEPSSDPSCQNLNGKEDFLAGESDDVTSKNLEDNTALNGENKTVNV